MNGEKLTVIKHFLVEIEGKYYLSPIGETSLDNAIKPELKRQTEVWEE